MIKTRFAPSPTGYLHIGGLRTALYNYLFAKQNQGKFFLRIEDTDQTRYVAGAEKALLLTLQKMGLKSDEGPRMDKSLRIKEKGKNGPYFQSKRLKIYQEYAQKLVEKGQAYYCFCSEERLADLRAKQQANEQPSRYDGLCRKLSENVMKSKLQNPIFKFVIRLKVPESGEVVFKDIIRGEVKFQTEDIDDQILLKSDGFPTYHLAVVVDDHLMGVSHVIRGEEWLSSSPKHILLYEAFGWTPPQFAHLPLLLNKDRSKLSKRQGDVAVEDYLNKGYLPEALINYVALLGWHPQDDREFFSPKDLIKEFDLKRVQKAGAVFSLEKLNWFNSYYLKQKSEKELIKLCQEFTSTLDKKLIKNILSSQRDRLETLGQIQILAESLLKIADYQPSLLIFKKSNKEKTKKGLEIALTDLSSLKRWNRGVIKDKLERMVKNNNLTNSDLFWPVRVALSGQEKSAPPEEIMEIIGKEEGLKRMRKAIDKIKNETL